MLQGYLGLILAECRKKYISFKNGTKRIVDNRMQEVLTPVGWNTFQSGLVRKSRSSRHHHAESSAEKSEPHEPNFIQPLIGGFADGLHLY